MPKTNTSDVTASKVNNAVFEEGSEWPPRSRPAFAFVNTTGLATKDAKVQRSIRAFVMRDHGKARRRGARQSDGSSSKASVILLPRVTIVADASPEYYESVQLVKAVNGPQQSAGDYSEESPSISHDMTQGKNHGSCNHQAASNRSLPPIISRFSAGRIDPFLKYPVEMTPRIQRLLDHVFDDQPNRNVKFYRDAIFPLGMTGAAVFHTVLSNLATYLRLARPLEIAEEYEAREELAHQARVFSLVKESITKKDVTGDEVISAVAALACHSHISGQMQTFHMHMNGLETLIGLRGGIQSLDDNQVLRNSLYWLGVNGYCTDDLIPSWPIPTHILPYQPSLPGNPIPSTAQHIANTWIRTFPTSNPFLNIFTDTAQFSVHLAAEEQRTSGHIYTDVVFAGNLIIGLIHRLLSAQSALETARPETVYREACRLALLLFLAPVRRRFGLHPVNTRVHVRKLVDVVRRGGVDWEGNGNGDRNGDGDGFAWLRLWIVGVGALEAVGRLGGSCVGRGELDGDGDGDGRDALADGNWLLAEWMRIAVQMGVTTAGAAERAFGDIMWVDTVHGKLFRETQERFFGRGPVLAPKP